MFVSHVDVVLIAVGKEQRFEHVCERAILVCSGGLKQLLETPRHAKAHGDVFP